MITQPSPVVDQQPLEQLSEVPPGPIELAAFERWYFEQPEDPGLVYSDPFGQFRSQHVVPLGW